MSKYGEKVRVRENGTREVKVMFDPKKGRTKQEFKDDCDINVLWDRFVNGGQEMPAFPQP